MNNSYGLGKAIFAGVGIVIAAIFMMASCSGAFGSELVAQQPEIDALVFIKMIWEARDSLPVWQLVLLSLFALVPLASMFTSVTPTPKKGTLWAFIYSAIEMLALKFYRSKDKPIDTEVRKTTGKPLELKDIGVQVIENELRGIVLDKVDDLKTGLFGSGHKAIRALRNLF